jgi:phage gpG-like protein
VRLTIELGGDKQLDANLLRMQGAIRDATPVWYAIMHDLQQVEKKQFDSEGEYASGGWQALSDSWLAYKKSHGFDERILRMTGQLFDSLTEWDSPWAIRHVLPGGKGFEFGTRVPYAAAHQNPRPGSHLPQRRPLELTIERREAYMRALLSWWKTGRVSLRPIA